MQRTQPSSRQSRARPGHGASPRRPVLSHRLPHSCSFSWPVAQLAARLRPRCSDKCDESVHEARLRARPRERTNAGPLSDRCAMAWAGAALQGRGGARRFACRQGWLAAGGARRGRSLGRLRFLSWGRARFSALRELTCRSMFERSGLRARREFCGTGSRARIAAQSARSGDRHSVSPRRVPPAATRGSSSALHGCRIAVRHDKGESPDQPASPLAPAQAAGAVAVGASSRPSGCRANLCVSRECTGALSLNGQPPNCVRL